jgi:hypothetical protein
VTLVGCVVECGGIGEDWPMATPIEHLEDCIGRHLAKPELLAEAKAQCEKGVPGEILGLVEVVLQSPSISYRDAILIQLAYRDSIVDFTNRPEGARSVAAKLGAFLARNHIKAVKDAYQNIGKNTEVLVRGNFKEFDEFLVWASSGDVPREALDAVFDYGCACVAATSRPVAAFPALDKSKLTFAAVMLVLDGLYKAGSQGAYEQFSVAALLHALVDQAGIPGLRVETKNLNASDKSSSAAGDIQIFSTGAGLVEAYEVTANNWEQKLDGVAQTLKAFDLQRINIVARVGSEDAWRSTLKTLSERPEDISVLDNRVFASSLVAALRKPGREVALHRLYEFLDRYQPDTDKTNRYVATLIDSGLV